MTFACLVKAQAIETYRNKEGRESKLKYRKGSWEHHVVVEASGRVFPVVYRFRSIEEARSCWREQRSELEHRGFEKVREFRS